MQDEKATKRDIDVAHTDETHDELLQMNDGKTPLGVWEFRSKTRVKNISCAPSKEEALHVVPSPVFLPRLFVIVSLLIVFVSIWVFFGFRI